MKRKRRLHLQTKMKRKRSKWSKSRRRKTRKKQAIPKNSLILTEWSNNLLKSIQLLLTAKMKVTQTALFKHVNVGKSNQVEWMTTSIMMSTTVVELPGGGHATIRARSQRSQVQRANRASTKAVLLSHKKGLRSNWEKRPDLPLKPSRSRKKCKMRYVSRGRQRRCSPLVPL